MNSNISNVVVLQGNMNEFDEIIASIKKKIESLPEGSCLKQNYMAHLRSLARKEEPMDYPTATDVNFPESIYIAYAVCHPECGVAEYIVDGSTQECQYCGGLMFRTEVAEYMLASKKKKTNDGNVAGN
jgi:hypothetical protein